MSSVEEDIANSLRQFYLKMDTFSMNAPAIPHGLESRIEKVSKEPIRITDSVMIEYLKEYEFTVKGSTGKVYKVKIGPKLDCECVDHRTRGHHCKHILYVLLKELHCRQLSSNVFATIYPNDNDLYDLFSNYHPQA